MNIQYTYEDYEEVLYGVDNEIYQIEDIEGIKDLFLYLTPFFQNCSDEHSYQHLRSYIKNELKRYDYSKTAMWYYTQQLNIFRFEYIYDDNPTSYKNMKYLK